MEERSLKILDTNKTFFSKIANVITKLLIPTKVSINNMLISIKRNSLLKAYLNYISLINENEVEERDYLLKRYEDAYSLYLEAIDKYIMNSVYKKVKNGTASNFEKDALSKYYFIVSLKEKDYLEYKYKKQEYLLRVDYESVIKLKKEAIIDKYNKFYVLKMDSLYKGLLKNYSIQLADTTSTKTDAINNIYDKIFTSIESYVSDILPIKLRLDEKEEYKNILEDYDKYEQMQVGKLDEKDKIRKKMILLGISRMFFTHSLPLIAAEKCYLKLIGDTRNLILNAENKIKRDRSFDLFIDVIEDYNVRLLSTKIYWENPEEREGYKKFWNRYNNIIKIEDNEKHQTEKQILFLKNDLKGLNVNKDKPVAIIKIIKDKLVELGAMKKIKNSYKKLKGTYKKVKVTTL